MSDYNDYCEDCRIYGDNYNYDEEGEPECRCSQCPFFDEESDRKE